MSFACVAQVECEREAYIRSRVPVGGVTMKKGIEILEGALAIGRQAEPLAPDIAQARMEAVRGRALIATPMPDRPVLGKVKAWLTAKILAPAE